MKRLIVLFVIIVTGCSTSLTTKTLVLPVATTDSIAKDSVALLTQHYPAAHTHLVLKNHHDDFGNALAQRLREQGYGLYETASSTSIADPTTGKELSYSLNTDGSDTVVTLFLAGSSFQRLYQRQGQQIVASSCWSRAQR